MGHFQGMRRIMGGFMPPAVDFARVRRDEREAEHVRRVEVLCRLILRKMERVMATLDDVLERTYAQKGQIDSLATLIGGIKAKLDEALGGGLSKDQQAKVDMLFTELGKNTAAITKAINANDDDPSNDEPAPAPAPAPVEPQPEPEPAAVDPVDETVAEDAKG